jgi:hypothetical protein
MKRQRPEQATQRAVVEHLRLRAKPGVVYWHTPNQRRQSPRQGVEWKRQGVLAGVSDLILLHDGNAFALELKADNGRLSEAQREFLDAFNNAGGYSAYAVGVDRAIECLKAWGLIR